MDLQLLQREYQTHFFEWIFFLLVHGGRIRYSGTMVLRKNSFAFLIVHRIRGNVWTHAWLTWLVVDAIGIYWIEARDAAAHPKIHRSIPTTKNNSGPRSKMQHLKTMLKRYVEIEMREGLPVEIPSTAQPVIPTQHTCVHTHTHAQPHAHSHRTFELVLCFLGLISASGRVHLPVVGDTVPVSKTFCKVHAIPELSALWRISHGKKNTCALVFHAISCSALIAAGLFPAWGWNWKSVFFSLGTRKS